MSLSELKKCYLNNELTKPEFIKKAFTLHQQLFEYVEIARSTDVKEIKITKEGVFFEIGNPAIRVYCPPNEARVAPIEIMNFDKYEPEVTQIMNLLTSECQNILDIGANIGWYTLYFAKQNPEARIFSFEPMPTSYSCLQRNVSMNNVSNRVATFNYGLSETNGVVEFFVAPGNGTNASLKNVTETENAVAVVGLTLTTDQWVQNYGIIPDFIKCDVEGAELFVFRGAKSTLEHHHPIVFTELLRKWTKPFGYHPNDVISYLKDFGYKCFGISSAGVRQMIIVSEETIETNYVFLHHQDHAKFIYQLDSRS